PHSQRHQADLRLAGQIKQFWLESGCVYGYRKIHLDLRDSGQQCGVNRVWRLMKRERIKKKIYGTREEARSDIFDYIEMFYNSKRRHGSSDQMSPTEYENQYYQRLRSV
ncbi:IS3 family transposase, partial [Salmonella enterica]|nr:IS3 family transposase [Salmonella enterica]